jgi:hypothetical protein
MSSPASYPEQNWLLVRAEAIILGIIGMLLAVSQSVRGSLASFQSSPAWSGRSQRCLSGSSRSPCWRSLSVVAELAVKAREARMICFSCDGSVTLRQSGVPLQNTFAVDPALMRSDTEAMPTLGGSEHWNPSGTHKRTAEEDVALSL